MPMPEAETVDATEEFLNEAQADDSVPTEPEKPEGEEPKETPSEEPGKTEPKEEPEKPVEEEGVLPPEELNELFAAYGGETEEESQPYQPPVQPQKFDRQPPPQPQPQTPELPPDVLQVTAHQFMPEGQDFDPMDIHTPGSPSNLAALKATAEQNRRFNAHERERDEQEQMARQNMEAMNNLDARMERENWPKALREKFWKKTTGNPLVLDMLADGFLLEERRVMRKAKKARPSGGNGESPAPVAKASRVTETLKSPDELEKEMVEMLGPRQSSGI